MASLTIDMPGSGENPVLYGDPAAERTYFAWLDYLPTRSEIDGARVGVWGGSFGAYWAARLAYRRRRTASRARCSTAATSTTASSANGWCRRSPPAARPICSAPQSLLDARGRAMGTKTMEEFLEVAPRFSLKTMGLLDKPSAPLLGVNGKLDDQAPVDDIYLLMEHGSPKSARVYADGHHMGRTPGQPAEHITTTIVDWLREQLVRA